MRKKQFFLRAVSALLLVCMALTACKKPSKEQEETTTETVQSVDLSQYVLISDGYKLIRPDIANDNVVDMFKILHGELSARYGKVFPSDNDWVERGQTPPQDNKEILLGMTNREDSTAVYQQLADRQYKVCMTEHHVVIVSNDDLALYYAVNAFLDQVVADEGGRLYVPKDLNLSEVYT